MLGLILCEGDQATMSQSKLRRMHQCSCPTCQQHRQGQTAQQHNAINRVLATLNEKNRRHFVGLLALQWGPRKIALLSQITGLSRTTIHRGKREVERPGHKGKAHIRTAGAGRIAVEKNNRAF
jgi:hypothetical protein